MPAVWHIWLREWGTVPVWATLKYGQPLVCFLPLNSCSRSYHTNVYIYMGVVLNKSSQEPPFRKSFASFRGPIRVAFSKIKNSYQESNIWTQTNSNANYTINWLLFAQMNGSNQNVIVICCFFSLGPISGMAKCSPFWAGHGSSGYVFRASFARLSRTFRSKS